MPKGDFYNNVDSYINKASENTDKKLALYISSLTTLKDEEILSLFPDTNQLKDLAALIDIVSKATDHNEKMNEFMGNTEKLASVAVKLLGAITSR